MFTFGLESVRAPAREVEQIPGDKWIEDLYVSIRLTLVCCSSIMLAKPWTKMQGAALPTQKIVLLLHAIGS